MEFYSVDDVYKSFVEFIELVGIGGYKPKFLEDFEGCFGFDDLTSLKVIEDTFFLTNEDEVHLV
jgi:hypothetical protein